MKLFFAFFSACLSLHAIEYPLEALRHNVAFAQVREDPWEEEAILKTYFSEKKDLSVLLIASGGDTAAYLAGSSLPITRLDLVDPNRSQLDLTKLKIRLLQADPKDRLALLGHSPMEVSQRVQILKTLFQELGIEEESLGNLEQNCLAGVDFAGRYEVVFAAFREELKPFASQIEALFQEETIEGQAEKVAPGTPLEEALKRAFEKVFSQENLVQIFGEKATANRVQEFSQHFAQKTLQYLRQHRAADSPYLAQLLLGHFYEGVYAPWYYLPATIAPAEIHTHPSFLHTYLQKAPKQQFDLVHLSNITDWLSPEEARETLSLAFEALKPGGVVVIRQLNSQLDLYSLGQAFEWDLRLAEELHAKDRSFFYRGLLIGRKPLGESPLKATQMADAVLRKSPLLEGAFFQALRERQMTLEQFRKTQQQFFFAVNYFSRPMAALMARLPDPKVRASILENILEEHGEFDWTHYHANTFRQFLQSIGTSLEGVSEKALASAFNLSLMGASLSEEPSFIIGCFGLIEYAFADISAWIGEAVVDQKWVAQEDLVHYSLHARLDKRHAEEFFILVEADLEDPWKREQFQAGLEFGAYIFHRLYEDLWLEAQSNP